MSVSPLQKRSKPPPVPDTPTVMRAPLFARWKASAAAVANGATVLDPSAVKVPETLPENGRAEPVATHVVAARTVTPTSTTVLVTCLRIRFPLASFQWSVSPRWSLCRGSPWATVV